MNIEHLDQLPDGKTELPATVTVNKLRGDVQLNFKIHLTLKGEYERETVRIRKED